MQPYQQRVIDEQSEITTQKAILDDRRAKLQAFLAGAASASLANDERERMEAQLEIMNGLSELLSEYLGILAMRIAAFPK